MRELICFGHRGAAGYAPENTLQAFRLAIDMGCPWIELDVHAVEGELLVIHDDRLARTTNGHGRVSTSSLRYLRSLDAGMGERIPTLNEVLDISDRRCGINIELKGQNTAEPVNRFLSDAGRRGWQRNQFIISSFDHRELALADPAFPRGVLFRKKADYLLMTRALNAHSLNLALRLVDQETVDAAHMENLKVYVFTVNDPGDIKHMKDIGVDGVFSYYPDRVKALNDGY